MQKNEIAVIEIEDMGAGGEGIGKADGYTLFVKDAVIGDVVEVKVMKAKKHYGYARLMKIVKPSEQRVAARCPEARRCGGCQIQEMDYQAQLAFKNRKVRNHLLRLGEVPEELLDRVMEPVCGMEEPFRYRNKAQFPVGRDREGNLTAGFYAGRTHSIIPVPELDCLLGAKENQKILRIILEYMKEYGVEPYDEESGRGLVRHVLLRKGFSTGELMVCLVINGRKLPRAEALIGRLKEIPGMTSISCSVNMERTNVIMGSEILPLYGKDYITDRIGPVKYQISPLSFYQVNPVMTEKLYGAALEYAELTGSEVVWDLYCGIGTISLFLAQQAKQVYGVEIVPAAIEDARRNARINGIENAEFYVGKAEEVLPDYYARYEKETGRSARADVIVVDPPRKGCDEALLETIVKMQPERVVYVSCDSATLARDVKYLRGNGYEVRKVRAFDPFCQTVHVETVVLLSHKSPDSVINVKVEFGEGDDKISLDAIAERAKKYQPKPKITYKMIQEYVEKKYGFKVHTAYIAEVKRALGLSMYYDTPNAAEELKQPRKHPPKEKAEAIMEALKHFEVI
ncbi:23S rRNA (uracil(1939)-C(5))-methyltransferase RlmD [Mordavella massiliensis]|nr:23S rRNA (uracil(1939)-C(5))-methyltransferase RlmD [Mordavella massiliensis]